MNAAITPDGLDCYAVPSQGVLAIIDADRLSLAMRQGNAWETTPMISNAF
jgi:hypothetical protein